MSFGEYLAGTKRGAAGPLRLKHGTRIMGSWLELREYIY